MLVCYISGDRGDMKQNYIFIRKENYFKKLTTEKKLMRNIYLTLFVDLNY